MDNLHNLFSSIQVRNTIQTCSNHEFQTTKVLEFEEVTGKSFKCYYHSITAIDEYKDQSFEELKYSHLNKTPISNNFESNIIKLDFGILHPKYSITLKPNNNTDVYANLVSITSRHIINESLIIYKANLQSTQFKVKPHTYNCLTQLTHITSKQLFNSVVNPDLHSINIKITAFSDKFKKKFTIHNFNYYSTLSLLKIAIIYKINSLLKQSGLRINFTIHLNFQGKDITQHDNKTLQQLKIQNYDKLHVNCKELE